LKTERIPATGTCAIETATAVMIASMAEIAPMITVSGATPATPKKTTDGTPSRFLASARPTISGSTGCFCAIISLPAQ
jgi:hypothetical protein